MDHHCPDLGAVCRREQLCAICYGRELAAIRAQARVIGERWAERIARTHAGLELWPEHDERTMQLALRLVRELAEDPCLLDELAMACSDAAAGWWERRPAQYRR